MEDSCEVCGFFKSHCVCNKGIMDDLCQECGLTAEDCQCLPEEMKDYD